MILSFRPWIAFLLFISQMICIDLKIIRRAPTYRDGVDPTCNFVFEILHGETETPNIVDTLKEYNGAKCLKKGDMLKITGTVSSQKTLKKEFNLAFNAGVYSQHEKYEEKTKKGGSDNEDEDEDAYDVDELCVLWGSWWPSENNPATEVEFYFSVFTLDFYRKDRFLMLFDLDTSSDKFHADLNINWMDSKLNTQQNPLTKTIPLTKRDCFPEQNTKIEGQVNYLFGGRSSSTHEGNGKFKMILLANKKEEETEANGVIEAHKVNPDALLPSDDSKIAQKIQCDKNNWSFEHIDTMRTDKRPIRVDKTPIKNINTNQQQNEGGELI